MSAEMSKQLAAYERAIESYNPPIKIEPSLVKTQELHIPFEFVDLQSFTISGDKIQIPNSYIKEAFLVRNTFRIKAQAFLLNRPGTSVSIAEFAVACVDIIDQMRNNSLYLAKPKAMEVIEHVSGATWLFAKPIIETGVLNVDIEKAKHTFEMAQARVRLLRSA